MSDYVEAFLDHIRRAGYEPAGGIIADDKDHRLRMKGDRGKDTSAKYKLKIENGHAFGWFISFKDGERLDFNMRDDRSVTPQERVAEARRRRADAAKAAEEQEAGYARVAARAQEIWKAAAPAPADHPYAKRKRIDVTGLKVDAKGNLLVPAYDEGGKIVNIQTIYPSGEKRFMKGGRITGCYYPIAVKGDIKGDASDRIVLCEGLATGKQLRADTGLPVVVCFFAGNIEPVAVHRRARYEQAQFIIAGDNDQWVMREQIKASRFKDIDLKTIPGDDPRWTEWRQAGYLWNPGAEAAAKAANRVGGRVTLPFAGPAFQHPDRPLSLDVKPTDFNDLAMMAGSDAVRAAFAQAAAPEPAPDEPDEDEADEAPPDPDPPPTRSARVNGNHHPPTSRSPPPNGIHRNGTSHQPRQADKKKRPRQPTTDWRAGLVYKDDMQSLQPKSLRNLDLFLLHHEEFAGIFVFDEFARTIIVHRCPPWEDGETFTVRRMAEEDVTRCMIHLESFGLKPGRDTLYDNIISTAKKMAINPARTYFEGLKWDGRPRLDTWLTYYLGAEKQPPEYLRLVGSKWLMQAVNRVLVPGCQADYMLILEGAQGVRKSTALRELATINGVSYHTDDAKDIKDKDTLMVIHSKLIVEFAEMHAWSKAESGEMKNFITKRQDEFRLPYGRITESYPRQFVLAGTINPEGDYFKDSTGNRRYWPVVVGSSIDIDALKKDREQLWAEAVHRFKAGEPTYVTPDDQRWLGLVTDEQSDRLQEDPWQQDVAKILDELYPATTSEVLGGLSLDKSKQDVKAAQRVGRIASALGYEYKNTRAKTGQPHKAWQRIKDAGSP